MSRIGKSSRVYSDAFYAALDRLPQIARVVYLLHARDRLDFEAIAFRIGEDVAAVEVHVSTALKLLVAMLDQPNGE